MSPKHKRFLVEVVPAFAYLAGVFYGGSIPLRAPPIAQGLPFDKLLHLIVFGGLHVLALRAIRYRFEGLRWPRLNLVALAATSGFGLVLELYQSLLPHRSAELLDWVADTAGAALAALALQLSAGKLGGAAAERQSGPETS